VRWIFNDQFIAQSPLSPNVKEFWKSVNIYQSFENQSTITKVMGKNQVPCFFYSRD